MEVGFPGLTTMRDSVQVTFEPVGIIIRVPAGITIYEAAQRAGVGIEAPCGGQGTCGKCRVLVTDGVAADPDAQEQELLTPEELAHGTRLACRAQVLEDVVVRVEATQALAAGKNLEQGRLRAVALDPDVRRYDLQLPTPTLQDQRSDFRRIADAVSDTQADLTASVGALGGLASALRGAQQQLSVITAGAELVEVRPASARGRCLGVAVDIGTSTVATYLVDLETGAQLATAAAGNPQAQFGADVISRIEYSNSNPGGLRELRAKAVEVINELMQQAVAQAGADCHDVYEVTVVGNTCMHHLFLGLEPRYLAQSPYVPVTTEPLSLGAAEVGLDIHPRGKVFCLPCIAGFVGADTVGVILASELTRRTQPVLAVDIGTNGELALWSGERLLTASCAAGPAFEGAQIEHGMRAAPGAIDHVSAVDGNLVVHTIGDQPARGICGSGLFDAMAVVLEVGLVDKTGRIVNGEVSLQLPGNLAERLQGEGPRRQIVLADSSQAANGPVTFTQRDIRELQLAKSAIRASAEMLLDHVGLSPDDLEEIQIAGAFGNFIDPASALRMGLLPDVPADRISAIGNAAGAGAILALLSRAEREYSRHIAQVAEHIELFRSAEFQTRFAEYMMFE